MSYSDDTLQNQITELQLKIESQTKTIEMFENEEKEEDSGPAFDYYRDVKRLERHCKMLSKKIKACKDDDKMIKLLNCLGFVQNIKKQYTDDCLGMKRLLAGKPR